MIDLDSVYKEVSEELNLPYTVVKRVYQEYWKFIRETVKNNRIDWGLSEEEFKKLKTSIVIPCIGKLACSYKRYLGLQKKHEILKNYPKRYGRKKDKADVHQDIGDDE